MATLSDNLLKGLDDLSDSDGSEEIKNDADNNEINQTEIDELAQKYLQAETK